MRGLKRTFLCAGWWRSWASSFLDSVALLLQVAGFTSPTVYQGQGSFDETTPDGGSWLLGRDCGGDWKNWPLILNWSVNAGEFNQLPLLSPELDDIAVGSSMKKIQKKYYFKIVLPCFQAVSSTAVWNFTLKRTWNKTKNYNNLK